MVTGALWSLVALKEALDCLARWAIFLGMWGLWLGLSLSAAAGTSEGLPMAGAGYRADPLVEEIVSAIVLGTSAMMTVGWALFLWGLLPWRRRHTRQTS
jgi:hypothetical protein